jgi:hypothetical protein
MFIPLFILGKEHTELFEERRGEQSFLTWGLLHTYVGAKFYPGVEILLLEIKFQPFVHP